MRRLLLLLTAGLAVVTFGCSSSEESATTTTAIPSTTSSVVVSAANQPACDAITAYKSAADVELSVPEDGDPTDNAMKIQAYLSSLVSPLEAVGAAAPADLLEPIDTLVTGAESIIALDPTTESAQKEIGVAILVPSRETIAAQKALFDWSAENCGIKLG